MMLLGNVRQNQYPSYFSFQHHLERIRRRGDAWCVLACSGCRQVERTLDGSMRKCPFPVWTFLVQNLFTRAAVSPSHARKKLFLMAVVHVVSGTERHMRWKKFIKVSTVWTSYALKAVGSGFTLGTGGTLGSW